MKRHPFLFCTEKQIELARKRVAECDWARRIRDDLVAQAKELAEMELPTFDVSWWRGVGSKKQFKEISAEIQEYTDYIPAPPIRKAHSAALAYALTDDPDIAGAVGRVLLHYVSYPFEYEHPDMGLNWSKWGVPALEAYDLIFNTLPLADRRELDDFFAKMEQAIHKNDRWWIKRNWGGLFNNHYVWHKLFIGAYGLFYQKDELVDFILSSDQGIKDLMDNGVRDGGLRLECSLNQHFIALLGIAHLARLMRNSGYPFDLYKCRFADGRTLRDLFAGIAEVVLPDMSLPTIGNVCEETIRLPNVEEYAEAWDVYRNPTFAWIASQRDKPAVSWLFLEETPPSAEKPSLGTRLLPEHAYAVLRTQEGTDYWRGDGFTAFFSFDSDRDHAHRDKFDFILFGRGKLLLCDPEAESSERHAIRSAVQRELNVSTLSHNTVMVDLRGHATIGEKLTMTRFLDLPEVKLVSAADRWGTIYPGVIMQRTIAATDDFVLDIFRVASEQEHTYDFLIHALDDDGETAMAGDFRPFHLPTEPPWSWLRNARCCHEDGEWSAEWKQGDLITRATMLGERGTRIILCDFPRTDQFEPPPIPMLIARRRRKATTFVVCYQSGTEIPEARLGLKVARHGALLVTMDVNGARREFLAASVWG